MQCILLFQTGKALFLQIYAANPTSAERHHFPYTIAVEEGTTASWLWNSHIPLSFLGIIFCKFSSVMTQSKYSLIFELTVWQKNFLFVMRRGTRSSCLLKVIHGYL
jgi:hypothetical protein